MTARTSSETRAHLTAEEIIKLLELAPHPEGGYFRETYRDTTEINGRSASTAIYFLLAEGQSSHWHKVDASEVWHWYAGSPLELGIAPPGGPEVTLRLGSDLAAGERPQAIVPPNVWQRAKSTGGWTLVGCTVAPGFTFEGFELAPRLFKPPTS